jgi:hypothetical protein
MSTSTEVDPATWWSRLRRLWEWRRAAPPPPPLSGDDLIKSRFRDQVNKACALLDFLIDEGHPYHISDEIIQGIENAQELLKSGDVPAKERAEFLKAYRDLVALPDTSVVIEGVPPIGFLDPRSWWLYLSL